MAPSTPEPKRATAAGGAPLRVLVASDAGLRVDSADDVLAVIGAAYDVDALILTAADVAAAFFDLRSGLAGELFQKSTRYGVRLALVLPDPAAHGPRWPELAFEHRRHAAVRIVGSRAEADAWLAPGSRCSSRRRGAPPGTSTPTSPIRTGRGSRCPRLTGRTRMLSLRRTVGRGDVGDGVERWSV